MSASGEEQAISPPAVTLSPGVGFVLHDPAAQSGNLCSPTNRAASEARTLLPRDLQSLTREIPAPGHLQKPFVGCEMKEETGQESRKNNFFSQNHLPPSQPQGLSHLSYKISSGIL